MSTRSTRFARFGFALAVALFAAPVWSQSNGGPVSATTANGSDDAAWLRSVLEAKGIDEPTRVGAARRLLTIGDPPALQVLEEGLRQGEAPVMEAVLNALIAEGDRSVPNLLASAVADAMPKLPPDRRPQVVPILARSEEPVGRLAAVALDRSFGPELRILAINALDGFRTTESVAALVDVLDPAHNELPEVVTAACQGLTQLTNFDYGNDVEAWRQWWQQVQGKPLEEFLQVKVRSLEAQVADRQRQIDDLQRELDRRTTRLTQAYQELFVSLSPEQRQDRMVALLADDTAPIRVFALDAVDRMIRNGEVPAPALQQALAERLADREPTIRALALRLLDDLGSSSLKQAFAASFQTEQDPKVIEAYLDVLVRHPAAAAFPRLVQLLDDPKLDEAAARAVFRLYDEKRLPDDWREQVQEKAERALDVRWTPAFVRLYGISCDASGLVRLQDVLQNDDPLMRRAAAEALRRRGQWEPLVAKLDDEAVFPAAVRALADPPVDLARIRQLAAIRPPESLQSEWEGNLQRAANAIPLDEVLAADDALASLLPTSPKVRIEALLRLVDAEPGTISNAVRRDAVLRVCGLLLELGDAKQAMATLDRTQLPVDADIDALRFRALALGGDFDRAARLSSKPEDWLSLFRWAVPRERIDPVMLRDEIRDRFGEAIDQDEALSQAFHEASAALDARPRSGVGPVNTPTPGANGGHEPRRNDLTPAVHG
ncbi:MAG: hypothetical protein KDA22_09145 [Phycisphaerales bacterium]|nr:hypothetical protein [Phycisphaerales bacterium]